MGCWYCSVDEVQTHWHNVLKACACFSASVASAAPQYLRGGGAELPAFFTDALTTTPLPAPTNQAWGRRGDLFGGRGRKKSRTLPSPHLRKIKSKEESWQVMCQFLPSSASRM